MEKVPAEMMREFVRSQKFTSTDEVMTAMKNMFKDILQEVMETEDKITTESKPLSLTGDSFPKIIVRQDIRKRWYDDNGFLNIGIIDFLLDKSLF